MQPEKQFVNWQQDPHGNFLARFVFPEKAREFSIEVDLVAEMTVVNPFDFFLEPCGRDVSVQLRSDVGRGAEAVFGRVAARPACMPSCLAGIDRTKIRSVDFLVMLNGLLHDRIKYVIRMDPGVQSCEETLRLGSGSCRDTAWLLVQTLRNLGLAARFVSGYLIQLTADIKSLDGPPGPPQDFTDLHAWAEVYLPGAGWIGLDATSGLWAGEGHIPLAATPDPASAAPVTGAVDPCEAKFSFAMSVTRIHEDPRVTKPYTEEQWQRIESLGHRVDAELEAGAVRLTMGGEPTFVSIDDMDGAEWNTLALGKNKAAAGRRFDHAAAKAIRRERPVAHRARKMVSRRIVAALGAVAAIGAATASRFGTIRGCWPTTGRITTMATAEARTFVAALAQRLGVPDFAIAGLRRCLALSLEGRAAADQCRSAEVET